MKRYAIVRNADTRGQAEAYLPGNYQIIHEVVNPDISLRPRAGETAEENVERVIRAARERPVFVIAGEDSAGWTLDGYVIPRYASGLIWAEEIDLSHPIMKQVPA